MAFRWRTHWRSPPRRWKRSRAASGRPARPARWTGWRPRARPTRRFRWARRGRPTTMAEAIASSLPGTDQLGSDLKTRVIGDARLAPLIGSVGDGSGSRDKPGGTVFVTLGAAPGFNEGVLAGGGSASSVAFGFSSSGTSTAAISVASAGFLARPGAGGAAPYKVMANSLQTTAPRGEAPMQTAYRAGVGPFLGAQLRARRNRRVGSRRGPEQQRRGADDRDTRTGSRPRSPGRDPRHPNQ